MVNVNIAVMVNVIDGDGDCISGVNAGWLRCTLLIGTTTREKPEMYTRCEVSVNT